LQEIKSRPEQLDAAMREPKGYQIAFNPAKRPGYSGTAIFTRKQPDEVWTGIGDPQFDDEGRVTAVRFGDLHILSAYYPNSREEGSRLDFKVEFCAKMLKLMKKHATKGQDVV